MEAANHPDRPGGPAASHEQCDERALFGLTKDLLRAAQDRCAELLNEREALNDRIDGLQTLLNSCLLLANRVISGVTSEEAAEAWQEIRRIVLDEEPLPLTAVEQARGTDSLPTNG